MNLIVKNDPIHDGLEGQGTTELTKPANHMADPSGHAVHEQRLRSLWATFRNILLVVFLIFIFAILQMVMLQRICDSGMNTAASLEHQGLPTLNNLASLQEHLAIFQLYSYEYLFAKETEKDAKAKAMATIADQTHAELENIKTLFPEGEGRRLASNLEDAFVELNDKFQTVRTLADTDFAAAMKAMDRDIPPSVDRVAAAANELKKYGYSFSGTQASAAFGSFGWIKKNAMIFGVANIFVAFGAVLFVLRAARRSRAQLTKTLARLDERTQELAGSLSLVNATLESTTDGIVLIDSTGRIGNYNQQFVRMWGIAEPLAVMQDKQRLMTFMLPFLKHPEKFADKINELAAQPGHESFDVLELADEKVFECCSKPQQIQGRICGRVWSFRDVSDQKRMQREVEKTHQQLLLASRQAGMAEVATGVLHNVGNVLNSVNISTTLVIEGLAKSKVSRVGQLGELLAQNAGNLAAYVTTDATGSQLPGYVVRLAGHLDQERKTLIKECELIRTNMDHIKDIVAMQQNYAKAFGVVEKLKLVDLIEDALRLNTGALLRHDVQVIRDYQSPDCQITIEKHKLLQILVNLIRNAKYACDESGRTDKQMGIQFSNGGDRVQIKVTDNGVGIPAENLTRIFGHGFTTRKEGHGFGLHSAALAAKELGGSLLVHSDGPQRGAVFTIELPVSPPGYAP